MLKALVTARRQRRHEMRAVIKAILVGLLAFAGALVDALVG
jgi:hypothetical protein